MATTRAPRKRKATAVLAKPSANVQQRREEWIRLQSSGVKIEPDNHPIVYQTAQNILIIELKCIELK